MQRLLLQCLIAQPGLAALMPDGWHGEGEDGGAIAAVLSALTLQESPMSSPALMQMFEGTVHARALAEAEAGMLAWGEEFDVEAEFAGLIAKLDEGRRLEQFQVLQGKQAQVVPSAMSGEEREAYLRALLDYKGYK